MRCTYILSAFVAGAMAMPGASFPRAEAGDSTTVTTTSAPASTSSGLAEIPSAWDKVDLDKWVKLIVNETTDETSKTPEKKEHLDFAVDIVECYFDISDPASCEKKVLKPFAYYTRQGLIYSREYYKKIYNKYFAQIKKWKTQATSLASDFTHQDFTCDKGCNYFSMAKKVLHNWKSIFSGPSSMLGGFDISSAGLSFASGVVAATKSNVTEILQKEIKNPENIKEAFVETASILKKASVSGFAASALNVAWTMDNVFIAKASEKIDDQKPADMDLSLLSDKARTCDGEGTCYFFIVAQNISNIAANKWTGAKGIEKIEGYNITLLDIAQSAVWHQKQFKGYSAQPNATALLQSLQTKETKPDLSYFINLPVVDYDKAKSTGSKKASSEKTFLTGLTKEISSIRGWPYAKSTKSSK